MSLIVAVISLIMSLMCLQRIFGMLESKNMEESWWGDHRIGCSQNRLFAESVVRGNSCSIFLLISSMFLLFSRILFLLFSPIVLLFSPIALLFSPIFVHYIHRYFIT